MPKRILYLSYFFEPDLGAGSFRNTALVEALQSKLSAGDKIILYTTTPNRYAPYSIPAPLFENRTSLEIHRIQVPQHFNQFIKQIFSFIIYANAVLKAVKKDRFDLVFASSSKLLTAWIAYRIARKNQCALFIDLRDLFSDNILELIRFRPAGVFISKIIRQWFEKPCMQYATHINLNSEGFFEKLKYIPRSKTSFYPNGIDPLFKTMSQNLSLPETPRIILYAGNIGEAQALDLLIPELASKLGSGYLIRIIGDGSARKKLIKKLQRLNVLNVEWIKPVSRNALKEYYQNCHFLLIHLNKLDSLKWVIPSKVFEYGCMNVPMIAGADGYARNFMSSEIKTNIAVFHPCDPEEAAQIINSFPYRRETRTEFIHKFDRTRISSDLAELIYNTLNKI